ncbi:ATP synthase alpha chain [Enhygromyxa salina]|uniref:ATP synthase alpha chain n=1 Tax=Enhygromyxa salina TaxID=215803 RepID=A0A0C2D0Q8_9BACT|nr:F0F1 ATP synthase subunit alpha [Enhygromyxa salina]KIG16826.1 ATP synthase alpha chain [Enhygromyxa salina]
MSSKLAAPAGLPEVGDPARPDLTARLEHEARRVLAELRDDLAELRTQPTVARLGRVVAAGDGVATAVGLEHPVAGELLDVDGTPARAEIVSEDQVRMILFGGSEAVRAGAPVRRTGRDLDVPAGIELIGRVVDALGRPIDRRGRLGTRRRVPVEGEAAKLADRAAVSRPLRTGLFVVDTMIPIGRGQRQLIVGDHSTGKSELCLNILAALEPEVIGLYVSIGRRGADTAANLGWLADHGFFGRGFAMVADADQSIGLVQLAPYAAMAMAEALMREGRDVVVVFDNLTVHAHAHRSLALLLGRPVGREAYPVDVFYAHARVLERAGQLGRERGGGSVTALPIIETQAGDLTAYIPTNLVSITDGQIRLDVGLVSEGQVPAVDVGLSVSRVGSKAQPRLIRSLAGRFKPRYAQFLELESFTRFGARVEAHAQRSIDWGRRVRRALRQGRAAPRTWAQTAVILLVLEDPRILGVALDDLRALIDSTCATVESRHPQVWARLELGDALEPGDRERVREVVARELGAQP